jgi:hypothetical protein
MNDIFSDAKHQYKIILYGMESSAKAYQSS